MDLANKYKKYLIGGCMKLVLKVNKQGTNEVYIDGVYIGVMEQMQPHSDDYSFMSNCPHDRLTGDHFIIIGHKLNEMNNVSSTPTLDEIKEKVLQTTLAVEALSTTTHQKRL